MESKPKVREKCSSKPGTGQLRLIQKNTGGIRTRTQFAMESVNILKTKQIFDKIRTGQTVLKDDMED